MNVATLGPKFTDSYKIAKEYAVNNFFEYKILEYKSFEQLFCGIIENKDMIDYIVMPMGYCNRDGKEFNSWVDFHFYYTDYIEIEDIFYSKTKDMVLIENEEYEKKGIVLQSATYQLARKTLDLNEENCYYVSSKPMALEMFEKENYQYTICSKDNYNECNRLNKNSNKYNIVRKFNPVMVWIVYKVTGIQKF